MTIYMEFTEAQAKFLHMTLNENQQIVSALQEGLAPFGLTVLKEVKFIVGIETVGIGYKDGEVIKHEELNHVHPEN